MSEALAIVTGLGPATPDYVEALEYFALMIFDVAETLGSVGRRYFCVRRRSSASRMPSMDHRTSQSRYQSSSELDQERSKRKGLLEFLQEEECAARNNVDKISTTSRFPAVAAWRPKIEAAKRRMQEFGVRILEKVGDEVCKSGCVVARRWGRDPDTAATTSTLAREVDWRNTMPFADPDGIVEVEGKG